jgi:hypothetical protein
MSLYSPRACHTQVPTRRDEKCTDYCHPSLSFLRAVECHSVGCFVNFFSLTPSQIGPTHNRKCSLSWGGYDPFAGVMACT